MTAMHRLPTEVTIYTVSELKGQCLAWMSDAATDEDAGSNLWPLDASAVDQVDAAGIQLLISLSRSLAQHERTLQLRDPSEPLARACASLGLNDWLDTCTACTSDRGSA